MFACTNNGVDPDEINEEMSSQRSAYERINRQRNPYAALSGASPSGVIAARPSLRSTALTCSPVIWAGAVSSRPIGSQLTAKSTRIPGAASMVATK